jgi:hypothetical protein
MRVKEERERGRGTVCGGSKNILKDYALFGDTKKRLDQEKKREIYSCMQTNQGRVHNQTAIRIFLLPVQIAVFFSWAKGQKERKCIGFEVEKDPTIDWNVV